MISFGSNPSPAAPPPPREDAWINSYQKLLPHWHSVSLSHQHSTIPISISRVNQFDAARLDVEMSAMLKEQLVKVFSLMKPGMLFQYEPELDAFLEFLIWRFSIWVDKPTPGIALMNLRYRDERVMEIRGKEAIARRVWGLMQRIEGIYKAASFGNLLIFLYTGRYRNLIERALRARLVYESPNMNRAVSFEYMNRQLVWNEFSEMLLLLLPLLNSLTVKSFLQPFSKNNSSGSAEDDSTCPICRTSPTLPYLALPCQHRYCYYCLRTRCVAAPSFRCSRCNEPVEAMQRHGSIVGHKTNTQ
ncbi:Peroxisome bioproteinsis protein 2 [Hibiscus syriacus]|uniref:RING-type E3 ubiquitin transferase (cysteine targeting) n=1 Tax=Hibiscus syriacus TaxID=106335 RepID=A0A6A3AZH4_HIBSY|nr:Peroxisome bioproteinsis protein 2 [Hibiscus syriacus]